MSFDTSVADPDPVFLGHPDPDPATGCVELRSEIHGPICSGYVPFSHSRIDRAQLFRVEVARLEEPVRFL